MDSDNPTGWRRTTVGEVFPFTYGKALRKADRVEDGPIPVFGSNGPFAAHDTPLVDGPAVVIGRKGSVGEVHWSSGPCWVGDTAYFVLPSERYDIRYAYYTLQTLPLTGMNTDSAVPGLNRDNAHRVTLDLPPITEQQAIAEVLVSIDDRIEWCESTATRCLEALRVVSAGGTRRVPVADIAVFVNGGAFTKGATGDGRLIIKISELNSGVSAASKFSSVDARPDRIADPGDILFSWSATLDVFRWVGAQALINQHIFKVIPSKGVPAWLVYSKLAEAMPTFQKIAADRATTMGHIKKAHLSQVDVPLFDDAELAKRDSAGQALWEKHMAVSLEADTLRRTRDALLPELVTGRLRIRDVDDFLERAGLA